MKFNILMCCIILLGVGCGQKKSVSALESQLVSAEDRVEELDQQLQHLREVNGSLLDRMEDLSIISQAGAENISNSLKSLSQQYDFVQDLSNKLAAKDSVNQLLVAQIKRSLDDLQDDDVYVEVKEGIVRISIADRMLFRTASARLTNQASGVLEKIASVVNDHNDFVVQVEGHTDNVPIENGCMTDNWDLSVKRATSVVRTLQHQYQVEPDRMIAAGRAEYSPKTDNSTDIDRAINRRTEIILTPRLEQFFALLDSPVFRN